MEYPRGRNLAKAAKAGGHPPRLDAGPDPPRVARLNIIAVSRPQPFAHPVRDRNEFRAVANVQGPLFRQRAFDHIGNPPRSRAHHHDLRG